MVIRSPHGVDIDAIPRHPPGGVCDEVVPEHPLDRARDIDRCGRMDVKQQRVGESLVLHGRPKGAPFAARDEMFGVVQLDALHDGGYPRQIVGQPLALRHGQRARKRAHCHPRRDADVIEASDVGYPRDSERAQHALRPGERGRCILGADRTRKLDGLAIRMSSRTNDPVAATGSPLHRRS